MLLELLRSTRFFRKVIDKPPTARPGEIYVNLMGGLGNQLFQYAFAQFLVRQNLAVKALVPNYFSRDPYRRSLVIGEMSSIPIVPMPPDRFRALSVLRNEDGRAISHAVSLTDCPDSLCQGYWQDPCYAEEARDAVSTDLLTHYNAKYRATNASESECVVHVRRSDYGHHGLLPLDYYLACLEESRWPDFFVVTDEPNFCEHVFARIKGFGGVIRGEPGEPWPDFYFMFRSRIQVIANSSFSWWTAWLGQSAGVTAKVFAPGEWSLVSTLQPCPTDWSRINTRLLRP